MITKELLSYIKGKKEAGVEDDDIRKSLFGMGWRDADVSLGMKVYKEADVPVPPYETEKSHGGYKDMWDTFLHVLMFISLYVVLVSSITIFFNYIDYIFPYSRYGHSYPNSIRMTQTNFIERVKGPMSWLIVSLPVFILLFTSISKKTKDNPELRNLPSRKRLIYLTLVITFVTILVSVFYVVYSILDASLNLNLSLKLLLLIGMCASIFAYYLNQVREDRTVAL